MDILAEELGADWLPGNVVTLPPWHFLMVGFSWLADCLLFLCEGLLGPGFNFFFFAVFGWGLSLSCYSILLFIRFSYYEIYYCSKKEKKVLILMFSYILSTVLFFIWCLETLITSWYLYVWLQIFYFKPCIQFLFCSKHLLAIELEAQYNLIISLYSNI